jgi:hypothetical protein
MKKKRKTIEIKDVQGGVRGKGCDWSGGVGAKYLNTWSSKLTDGQIVETYRHDGLSHDRKKYHQRVAWADRPSEVAGTCEEETRTQI